MNQYGFYIYSNENENTVVNVSLGFLEEIENVAEYASENSIINSMVDSAVKSRHIAIEIDGGGGGGTPIATDRSGQIIAYANLENILYIEGENTKIASYTIYTQVVDVAKVKETSSSYTRGIYDITTTVIVDAEPSFWVKIMV